MNYTFKTHINKEEYMNFIKTNSAVSFMQEYDWYKTKTAWDHLHCGLYDNNQLVGVCSILIRKLPGGIKLFYVPRGFITNFNNFDLVDAFTKEIKKVAKENNAYSVKIDPNFCCKEYSLKDIKSSETIQIPKNYSKDFDIKHNNLLKSGFKHHGFTKKISASAQPRYNMFVPLITNENIPLTDDLIKISFKKGKYYLGNYYKIRGVYFEHTNDINRLDEFMEIINLTEARQNISLRNKEYFKTIMENFDAYLFFGKLNLEEYLTFLTNKGTDAEIDEIKKLIEKGNKIINLSTSLVILPNNVKGIRTSEYLYAGNNLHFNKLNVSYGLVYDICKFSKDNNCTYCNLGGVDGTLDDHLTTFKSRFNPIVFEFAGEYDLIIKPLIYYPVEKLFPIFKKIYHITKK